MQNLQPVLLDLLQPNLPFLYGMTLGQVFKEDKWLNLSKVEMQHVGGVIGSTRCM